MGASLSGALRAPIRFVLVGALNTGVGLAIIYLLKWALHFGDLAANLCGYALGLTVSYVFNSRWTFAYRGSHAAALPRFLAVVLVAYAANLLVVFTVLRQMPEHDYFAHAAGLVPYVLLTFLGSRFFAFPHRATQ